jgi:hypothetical protein
MAAINRVAFLELPLREPDLADEAVQMPHQRQQDLAHARSAVRPKASVTASVTEAWFSMIISRPILCNPDYDAVKGHQHSATEGTLCPMSPSSW